MQALVSLLDTVYASDEVEAEVLEKDACLVVQPLYLQCLEDYTTDKRGDVGSLCAFLCHKSGLHIHSP